MEIEKIKRISEKGFEELYFNFIKKASNIQPKVKDKEKKPRKIKTQTKTDISNKPIDTANNPGYYWQGLQWRWKRVKEWGNLNNEPLDNYSKDYLKHVDFFEE